MGNFSLVVDSESEENVVVIIGVGAREGDDVMMAVFLLFVSISCIVRTHAILQRANNALEIVTPSDLHFLRIALDVASSNGTVSTCV